MKRKLTLSRESLAELTPNDLDAVVGAAQAATVRGLTCPFPNCFGLTDPAMTCQCNTEPGCIA